MPIFDFKCEECGNKFDLMISNRDKNNVLCPQCNSDSIKQLLSMFAVTTSRPSCSDNCASYVPDAHSCCGPGCCGMAH